MKMIGMAIVVAGMVLAAGSSFAGGACCASKKGGAAEAMSACSKSLAGLELTADQQTKIAEIEAACKVDGGSEESCTKARGEIRALLNDDQKAKFDASWEKMKAGKEGGCG